MRFLADMGISRRTVTWLREIGHDALHLNEQGLQFDGEVLLKAEIEKRVLLTMDLDFSYLVATADKQLPGIIVFRLSDERAELVNKRLQLVLDSWGEEIVKGVIVSVGDKSIRIRRTPI